MALNVHRLAPTAKARLPFVRPRESRWRPGPPRKTVVAIAATGLTGSGAAAVIASRRGTAARGVPGALARGYVLAPRAEQSGLALLSSFATAVAMARSINYAREQRTRIRPLKNWSGGNFRVHHHVPGIGLAFASGVVSVTGGDRIPRPVVALALGTGIGMTADEASVLIEREDVYWNTERLAVAETLAALAGATILGGDLLRRGLAAARADRGAVVRGYCLRERRKIVLEAPVQVSSKQGRPAIRGSCPHCGARVYRLGTLE